MRTSPSKHLDILRAPEPPRSIYQEPLDGDAGHYRRLCNLQGSSPNNSDLCRYADDILYVITSPIQTDLLRYLLPICLEAWRQDLLAGHQSTYGAFVEKLWPALERLASLPDTLRLEEWTAIEKFMAGSLLDAIDRESRLSYSGSKAQPYATFDALNAFSAIFLTLPALWQAWWKLSTTGRACTALQYLSCLLYPTDANPIFALWTPTEGGGPPCLWQLEGHFYDCGWLPENVAFLKATLTPAYIENRLHAAGRRIGDTLDSAVPQRMAAEFQTQRALLESRLAALPALLLEGQVPPVDWP